MYGRPNFGFLWLFVICLISQFISKRSQSGNHVTVGDLPSLMANLKAFRDKYTEDEINEMLGESHSNPSDEIDFESFLKVCCYLKVHPSSFSSASSQTRIYCWTIVSPQRVSEHSTQIDSIWQSFLNLQTRATAKSGDAKNSSAFLKATTTTLLHTVSESEKASYVAHINSYLGDDPFLKNYLPLDPATNDLFELAKDGVLLWWVLQLMPPLLTLITSTLFDLSRCFAQ